MKNINYFFLKLSVRIVLIMFTVLYPVLKFYKIH
jgi:hypothetical protein